jgi:fructose-1,6-bisphosphatase/sedoheptulose 1,7-bisphosphatase-like protein
MSEDNVIVLIDDSYRDRFAEVVDRAKAAGLRIDQLLQDSGVVTGSISAGKRRDLEQIQGIAAVETQRDIQIPPPKSDIQ